MKDKSHIIIIFSIIFGIIIISQVAFQIMKPESFDKFDHYRWNAVSEIMSQKMINQNSRICGECHKDIYNLHEKDAHYNVPCIDCHGAGNLHVAYHNGGVESKNITKKQAILEKQYKLEGCLFCHRKLSARPSDFPQIDKTQHFKFLNIIDSNTKCTECHSPHEPIFLLTDVRQSRLHPIVYRCTDCHNKPVKDSYSDVPNHPKIFECKDCHAEKVKEFNMSPHHKYVECRTCHLFHKEDESIGRIYKNGNANFCLLCHEKKSFKSETYPPKIVWPEHINKLGYIQKIGQKICLNCHSKQIHSMSLFQKDSLHPKNWRTEHKKFAFNKTTNKQNPSCVNCHQENFCNACHQLKMPHQKDFLMEHKDFIVKKGSSVCKNCHTQSFCGTCHG